MFDAIVKGVALEGQATKLMRSFAKSLSWVAIGSLELFIICQWASGALVCSAASPLADTQLVGQLDRLEHRFFFQQYGHDPLEKRLQRLELLIFGETQAGRQQDRLDRLMKAVEERDEASRQEVVREKAQGAGSAGKGSSSPGKAGSSTQYPILDTLEWRVLKKTHRSDTLDQRLASLERTLFGQASPAMSYADRVDRLKRTVGIGADSTRPGSARGPLPKARPRQEGEGSWPEPFGYQLQLPPGQFTDPKSPGPFPFEFAPGLQDGFARQFQEMFRDLDKHMQQMLELRSGTWRWDSEKGGWVRVNPPGDNEPDANKFPGLPDLDKLKIRPGSPPLTLPPYYDPNVI